MPDSALKNIDLKPFQQQVTYKFQKQGEYKKSLMKLNIFKDLKIQELWLLMK